MSDKLSLTGPVPKYNVMRQFARVADSVVTCVKYRLVLEKTDFGRLEGPIRLVHIRCAFWNVKVRLSCAEWVKI